MSTQSVVIQPVSSREITLSQPAHLSCKGRVNYLRTHLVGLLVITILLSYLAVVYGRIHSGFGTAPNMGLNWCAETPCYRNLVPGQTSWTAELAAYNTLQTQSDTAYRPSLLPAFDQRWLGTIILLLPPDTTLTAGDIVQLYGVPCRVDIDFYGNQPRFTLHYRLLNAQLEADADRLNVATRVHSVILSSPTSYSPQPASNPCARYESIANIVHLATIQRPWYGFTTLQQYLHDR